MKPAYIWYWSIQSLHRVDVTATLGQSTAVGLLIRGDGAGSSRRVAVFSSHPDEISLSSELSETLKINKGGKNSLNFLLSSTSVYELKVSRFNNQSMRYLMTLWSRNGCLIQFIYVLIPLVANKQNRF